MFYHDCVSALEVERVEATFKFVEVLGDLHVMVGWQPVPGGGDQIGKISCRILTEISHSRELELFVSTALVEDLNFVRYLSFFNVPS